jgi:hypothetical protein
MVDWKKLVKADSLGSYLEWEADGLHCVIRDGYCDVRRVFCYGEKAPFEPITFQDYNELTEPREFGQLYVGFEQFRKMGVLAPEATEEEFRTYPERTLSDEVTAWLTTEWWAMRDAYVLYGMNRFLRYVQIRKYALASFCFNSEKTFGITLPRHVTFVDKIHTQLHIFSVWDSMEEAREKLCDQPLFDTLEIDPDRAMFYEPLIHLPILRARLYNTILTLSAYASVNLQLGVIPPVHWKTKDAYLYAANNDLESPYEPFQRALDIIKE